MEHGWFIFGALLLAYLLVLFLLVATDKMRQWNLSLFLGLALMVRTKRGRKLMDWFAQARWLLDRSAHFGLYLTGFAMVAMTSLLVLQLYFVFQLTPEQAPSPRLILGIPGVNPIIPVGFGIVALIVAVVIHEFSHGIMARVYGLKVKTMGLLIFIVPIGAFVEPDEEELQAAPRKTRAKVFSAGPLSNLVFAILFAVIFSGAMMATASPVDGVVVQAIEEDGPAFHAGMQPGWVISGVDGESVACPSDFRQIMGNTTAGVGPNRTVTMAITEGAGGPAREIELTTARRADLYDDNLSREFYAENPDIANDTVIGVGIYDQCFVHRFLAHPFQSGFGGFLRYVSLPFFALQGQFPLNEPFNQFIETPFDADAFWFTANLVYWLFWINLMLGLTNALPIIPLDGGHMFRDFLNGLLEKLHPAMTAEHRHRLSGRIGGITALVLLGLIILQFVGPGLAAQFR